MKSQIASRVAFSSAKSVSSPSVNLEKGAYRMRASSRAIEPLRLERRTRNAAVNANSHLLFLVFLLALACLACFGSAYYLFTTRWDAAFTKSRHPTDLYTEAGMFNSTLDRPLLHELFPSQSSDASSNLSISLQEQFLAYLPHSGFHNQRIAFESALILARLLNRTLIVPPVRLGNKPLRYVKFDTLRHYLALSGKEGLYHCSRLPVHISLPPECLDYFDYTHIPWEWLVDLTDIKSQQRLIYQWNTSDSWFRDRLGILDSETLTLKDLEPYQFRFLDTLSDASSLTDKFKEDIYTPNLRLSPSRLIRIGTLFGSSRVRLRDTSNLSMRRSIRQSMSFTNPVLDHVVDLIQNSLIAGDVDHGYFGVHLRLGDGRFRLNSKENARQVWRKLLHDVLDLSDQEIAALDSENYSRAASVTAPQVQVAPPNLKALRCRSRLHTAPQYTILNTPLYIATDAADPVKDPSLSLFLRTFPCVFFLGDFVDHTQSLNMLRNDYDGIELKRFLLPFVDAMVAGRAREIVGTEGSTFSRFVEDVLWTTYHGIAVKVRG